MPSVVQDTPLTVIDPPNGEIVPKIPESRVLDGWQAHSIYKRLVYDDWEADEKRGMIDYQIDGGLPYSPEVMANAGRGEDANVNFMEAKSEDDLAMAPFIEMTTVSSTLWRIMTKFGDTKDNTRWSQIISEKFTKMVRGWRAFNYFRQRLAQQFTRHGAGFDYYEDDLNWQWRSDGLSAFKMARNTESYADAIDYCICKRSMKVSELYKHIRDEESAKEIGRWNVDAVKIAMRYASRGMDRTIDSYSYEEWMKEAKENDIAIACRSEEVLVYHLWVQEYDGTVAHYIGLQDGVAVLQGDSSDKPIKENKKEGTSKAPEDMIGNGFLYAHRQRFPSFESAIIPFFYSIGTHATIHTIRGQGDMNYTPIAISNRARCSMLDSAKAAGMILLQCETAGDAETLAYTPVGPFLLIPANVKVQANQMPNTSGIMQPILSDMASLRAQISPASTAQIAPQGGKQSKQPDTKYSILAKQNRGGSLNSAALTQFFEPWSVQGEESYRRAVNPELREDDPGGKEAFKFRRDCMAEGVPWEAMLFDQVTVEAVRVIGNGSPEARQFAAEQIKEVSSSFDPEGQYQANFQYLTSIPGVDAATAKLLLGDSATPRETDDDQFADLENSLFSQGAQAKVLGVQNHWVHCEHHMELVKATDDAFNQQQLDGPGLVKVLAPALDNMLGHSEYLTKDKTKEKESGTVRKFIQNYSGVLQQQQTKMLAEQRKAHEDQQGQQQQGDPQAQMEMMHKAQLHQMDLQSKQMDMEMKQKEFNLKLSLQNQQARLHQSIADTKAAIDLARENADLNSTQV